MDARPAPRYAYEPSGRTRCESSLGTRDTPDASETVTSAAPKKKKQRKRAHYLQHAVRCSIIRRVAEGEPQAALAREFGVTRAAVCQMYKNREEILAREDSEDEAEPRALALEGRSKTVQLLVTTLKDARTSAAAFRRAASRLSFILVEEALASYDWHGSVGDAGNNLERHIPFCGITLGDESASLTTALCQIDPDAPTGQIHVMEDQEDGRACSRLVYLDVPANITECEVFLFANTGNGTAECKAIEVLRNLGVEERSISLVMVVCSPLGYEKISSKFPDIAIIPAAIDDDWVMDPVAVSDRQALPLVNGPSAALKYP